MAQQPTSRKSILFLEWRVLKPLVWLLLAGLALFAGAWTMLNLSQRNGKAPKPVQIHADERLDPSELEFEILAEAPSTSSGQFQAITIYRIRLRADAGSLSHPLTLNFLQADEPETRPGFGPLVVAKLAGDAWRLLEGASPGSHPAVVLSIEVEGPGTYALGRFREADTPGATTNRVQVSRIAEGRRVAVEGLFIVAERTRLARGTSTEIRLEGEPPEDLRLLWFDSDDSLDGLEDGIGRTHRFIASEPGRTTIVFLGRRPGGEVVLRAELKLVIE